MAPCEKKRPKRAISWSQKNVECDPLSLRNLCTGYAASVLKKAGRKEMGTGRRDCRNGCRNGEDQEIREKREDFCKTYEEKIKTHAPSKKPIQVPKDLI